ncbi:hypothetical protein [Pedococcus sp. 5OH_020]|uniref:hypothetical protein n=1 Tax=Pedococcus sp. 5OH_020 TaxID=2989814 RepID=UPI0022E9F698|nr:hypothetical protein [Pedococcus sp. 5OH_020]
MAKSKRDATFDPVTIGTAEAAQDGVSIVRAPSGRMAFVPRSVGRLKGEALEVATELQELVARIREDQVRLEQLVLEGRECGMSWAAVGWCVGTTGDGARKRWGES